MLLRDALVAKRLAWRSAPLRKRELRCCFMLKTLYRFNYSGIEAELKIFAIKSHRIVFTFCGLLVHFRLPPHMRIAPLKR